MLHFVVTIWRNFVLYWRSKIVERKANAQWNMIATEGQMKCRGRSRVHSLAIRDDSNLVESHGQVQIVVGSSVQGQGQEVCQGGSIIDVGRALHI